MGKNKKAKQELEIKKLRWEIINLKLDALSKVLPIIEWLFIFGSLYFLQ